MTGDRRFKLMPGRFVSRLWSGRRFGLLEAGFLLVIIVALAMRLWELGGRTIHYDEAIHLHFAWRLSESSGAFLGWPWIFGTDYIHSPWMHGPFQIEFTALMFKIFGDTDVTGRLGYVLFGTALVAVPYFFREYLGRTASLMAAVMLALSPTILYFSRFGRNDIIMAFFASALLMLMWRYIHEGHRRYLYLASAVLALMFATKETAYLVVGIFGLVLILLTIGARLPWLRDQSTPPYLGGPAGFFLLLTTLTLPQWSALSGFFQGIFGLTLVNPDPQTGNNVANVDGTDGLVGAPAWADETLLLPVRDLGIGVHVAVVVVGLAVLAWLLSRGPLTARRILCIAGTPLAVTAGVALLLYRPLADLVDTRGVPALDLGLAALLATGAVSSLIYFRYPVRNGVLLLLIPALLTALYAVFFTPVLDLQAVVDGILPSEVTIGAAANGVPVNYVVALGVLSAAIIVSIVIGVQWIGGAWLVCAGIFYLIWATLYTTFFTHLSGVFSGSWQGMGYWVAQQEVARGNQPWYYYFVGLPVYELLPAVFGIAGAVYFIRRGDMLGLALIFWAGVTFLAYTLASEKMPWLLVNITLPLIFLSAKFLGELAESVRWRQALRQGAGGLFFLTPLAALGGLFVLYAYTGNDGGLTAQHWAILAGSAAVLALAAYLIRVSSTAGGGALATLGIAALLLGFGGWSALRAGYTFDDSNREILVYAQGGSDLKDTFAALEDQVFSSPSGDTSNASTQRRAVEVDYDIWYPFQWYVRNAESDGLLRFTCFKSERDDGWNSGCNSLESTLGEDEFRPDSLLLAADHAGRTGGELLEYTKSEPLHSLLWFPETYRRPLEARQDEEWTDELKKDLEFFKDVASSKGAWRSALSYWIFRDLEKDWFTGDYYIFKR
ncbi:MAG TPA: TIGR03663 family protein [Dehalococcoidia bacterium]|nr:TIGR03663 family protein [Dehalococcoidia bacterium]